MDSVDLVVISRDYDDWNTEGWSAKDLLPLFQKVCTRPCLLYA